MEMTLEIEQSILLTQGKVVSEVLSGTGCLREVGFT
jgi:hypothetical protein